MGAVAMRLIRLVSVAFALAISGAANAHVLDSGERQAPSLTWSFEPWVVILLVTSLVLYIRGWLELRSRTKLGRPVHTRRLLAFVSGWLSLGASLCSPLDTLSDLLFSVHMVQHEAMMIVAAPLMVLGQPITMWLWAFSRKPRATIAGAFLNRGWLRFWHFISAPMSAWFLHVAVLWGWHMPRYFEAALLSPCIHALQHLSFFLSATLLWWTIVGEASHGHRGAAMLSVFTTMVHTGALGALLTLAPRVWYPSYIETCTALGIDPLHDQQLGGLVMWVPTGLAYVIGAMIIVWRWLMYRSGAGLVGHVSPADSGEHT